MPTQVYKNSSGKRVPSVTTIIGKSLGWNKDILMRWVYNSMKQGVDPYVKRDEACTVGSLVHDYVEHHIYGTELSMELKSKHTFEDITVAERGLQQFKLQESEYKITWLETEYPLVSDSLNYGGCLDGVGVMGDVLFLGDIKTSNAIYPDHIIQLAAYNNLLREEGKYIPSEYWIFKIKKDIALEDEELVRFIPVSQEAIELGWKEFQYLRQMYDDEKVFMKMTKKMNEISNELIQEVV